MEKHKSRMKNSITNNIRTRIILMKYYIISSDSFTDEDVAESVDTEEEGAYEEEEEESQITNETLPENVTER